MILDPVDTQIIKQCHVTLKPSPSVPRETLLVVITTVMLLIWKTSKKKTRQKQQQNFQKISLGFIHVV